MGNYVARLPLKILIFAPFVAVEIGLLLWFHFDVGSRPTIIFVGTVSAGAFALFSFLTQLEDNRSAVSRHFMERWNDPGLAPMRDKIRGLLRDEIAITKIYANKSEPWNEEELKLRRDTIAACNFFEEMAIAILTGRTDEDSLFLYFNSSVEQVYEKLHGWIKTERDRPNGRQSFFVNFQELYERWGRRARRNMRL